MVRFIRMRERSKVFYLNIRIKFGGGGNFINGGVDILWGTTSLGTSPTAKGLVPRLGHNHMLPSTEVGLV